MRIGEAKVVMIMMVRTLLKMMDASGDAIASYIP